MNLTHPHILVVDDHADIRDLLKRFLEQHGYRVSCARDGREMKKLLEHSTIQLIVLDLMLPGEDGLTLCRELRVHSAIPIVMLTAMGEDMDRIVGLEMGADDYLAKPFNPRELLARIKAVLRRSQPQDEPPAEIGVDTLLLCALAAGYVAPGVGRQLRDRHQLINRGI